jgi:hypothetical protein
VARLVGYGKVKPNVDVGPRSFGITVPFEDHSLRYLGPLYQLEARAIIMGVGPAQGGILTSTTALLTPSDSSLICSTTPPFDLTISQKSSIEPPTPK